MHVIPIDYKLDEKHITRWDEALFEFQNGELYQNHFEPRLSKRQASHHLSQRLDNCRQMGQDGTGFQRHLCVSLPQFTIFVQNHYQHRERS